VVCVVKRRHLGLEYMHNDSYESKQQVEVYEGNISNVIPRSHTKILSNLSLSLAKQIRTGKVIVCESLGRGNDELPVICGSYFGAD
jgi:hypothetical protein